MGGSALVASHTHTPHTPHTSRYVQPSPPCLFSCVVFPGCVVVGKERTGEVRHVCVDHWILGSGSWAVPLGSTPGFATQCSA